MDMGERLVLPHKGCVAGGGETAAAAAAALMARRTMMMATMGCCKLYISAGRNEAAMAAIAAAAARHTASAPLLNSFIDREYNRTGYTLAFALHSAGTHPRPPLPHPLTDAVLDMVDAAFSHVDLQQHSGSHPRIGVVDHISFFPLASTPLASIASIAISTAQAISLRFSVPTYLYGAAHAEGKPLDAIRRALGYFSPNSQGQWQGATVAGKLPLTSDFGPEFGNPKTGVVVVGASPWIANFNIPIISDDLELGGKIARKVSARGGGLPEVQAMALLHGSHKVEIACNLTNTTITAAEQVQAEVARLAQQENLSVEPGYFTDYTQEQITEMAYSKLFYKSESAEQK